MVPLGHDYAMLLAYNAMITHIYAYLRMLRMLRTITFDFASQAKSMVLPDFVASKIIIARITQFYSNYAVLRILRSFTHTF